MQKEKLGLLYAAKNGGTGENVNVQKHNLHMTAHERLQARTQDVKQLHKPVLGRSVDQSKMVESYNSARTI